MFTIKIETDNAAFEFPEIEVARILRHTAHLVENGGYREGPVIDVNGNHVGDYWFDEEDEA